MHISYNRDDFFYLTALHIYIYAIYWYGVWGITLFYEIYGHVVKKLIEH